MNEIDPQNVLQIGKLGMLRWYHCTIFFKELGAFKALQCSQLFLALQ